MKYRNPVIPGFYPDPSICRAGDTFYLVTSSFQFFPGVPLFESKDLLNWTQIGHVLTRESQLPLGTADSTGGIYAPTIRCNNGRFYMVTTNVSIGGNFFVWTDDIHGEWSEPIYVEQDGIDPSLYFEDGKAYFMSNGTDDEGVHGIVQCEIDIETGKKLSSVKCIWQGTGGRFLESPHLYHIGKYYYLMASEGGTEYGHMVVYARGESIYGPFMSYAQNPVLTNRNLGGYLLQGCGHADLVDDAQGNWWMVHLGFRQIGEWVMHHTTGREVNLALVTFGDDGWFTAGIEGTNRLTVETDRLPQIEQRPLPVRTFENTKVGREWVFMKNPDMRYYDLSSDGCKLRSNGVSLSDPQAAPTFLGIRQQEMNMTLTVSVDVPEGEAGVTCYMTPDQHYEVAARRTAEGIEVFRRITIGDISVEFNRTALCAGNVTLGIKVTNYTYAFYAIQDDRKYSLGCGQAKFLSTEVAGNFTGVLFGLYAGGMESDEFASFTDFILRSNEQY